MFQKQSPAIHVTRSVLTCRGECEDSGLVWVVHWNERSAFCGSCSTLFSLILYSMSGYRLRLYKIALKHSLCSLYMLLCRSVWGENGWNWAVWLNLSWSLFTKRWYAWRTPQYNAQSDAETDDAYCELGQWGCRRTTNICAEAVTSSILLRNLKWRNKVCHVYGLLCLPQF